VTPADVEDYGFVFDGWTPLHGTTEDVDWFRVVFLGLPYVVFKVAIGGVEVSCRVDPCSCESAMVPYAEMVRHDLDHEIYLKLVSHQNEGIRDE
jgi:hypothetical protein